MSFATNLDIEMVPFIGAKIPAPFQNLAFRWRIDLAQHGKHIWEASENSEGNEVEADNEDFIRIAHHRPLGYGRNLRKVWLTFDMSESSDLSNPTMQRRFVRWLKLVLELGFVEQVVVCGWYGEDDVFAQNIKEGQLKKIRFCCLKDSEWDSDDSDDHDDPEHYDNPAELKELFHDDRGHYQNSAEFKEFFWSTLQAIRGADIGEEPNSSETTSESDSDELESSEGDSEDDDSG